MAETNNTPNPEELKKHPLYLAAKALGLEDRVNPEKTPYNSAIAILEKAFKDDPKKDLDKEVAQKLLAKLNEKDLSDEKVDEIMKAAEAFTNKEAYAEVIAFAKAKKENKEITYDEFKKQQTDADNGTLVVGGEEENKNNDRAWLANKVAIWKELAQEKQLQLEHTDGDDKFSLLKGNERLGTVRYTSESNAEVSPDAKLEMYLGLVKDAAKSGKTITLGDKLTDAQKAMLLAATLMSADRYKDGKKVALVNPPKIDTNAEYFKALPDDVKKILEAHNRLQEIDEKRKQRDEQIKQYNEQIKALAGKEDNESKQKLEKLRQERNALIDEKAKEAKELILARMNDEKKKKHAENETMRERVLLMRMGYTVKDPNEAEKTAAKLDDNTKRAIQERHSSPEEQKILEALAKKHGASR